MLLVYENQTTTLLYVAEKRDGTGPVTSGSNVKLKIKNQTDTTWWDGSAWDVETELSGTHIAEGVWGYDFSVPDGDGGDVVIVVWYNSVDGTVVQTDTATILYSDNLPTLSDIWTASTAATPGDQMDLINSPNPAAVTEFQAGLSTYNNLTDQTIVGQVGITPVNTADDVKADVSALALEATAQSIKTITDILNNLMDGANNRFTATALELAPSDTGATADEVWAHATRSLTENVNISSSSIASIASSVWSATGRTLTSFGTLVADTASAVWAAVSRTITGGTITTVSDKTGYSLASGELDSVALQSSLLEIKTVIDQLDEMIESVNGYRFTEHALMKAPAADEVDIAVAIASLTADSGAINITASGDAIDANANIILTRDDDRDIQFTWVDRSLVGHKLYLTVRDTLESIETDDTKALFQIEPTIISAEDGIFKVSFNRNHTAKCKLNKMYYYDIQSIDEDNKITTIIKARLTVTGDVTRRTTR